MTLLESVPASQLFRAVLDNAPGEHVSVSWLVRSLRERSFGMIVPIAIAYLDEGGVLLSIALCASVPSLAVTWLESLVAFGGSDFLFRMKAPPGDRARPVAQHHPAPMPIGTRTRVLVSPKSGTPE